VIAQSCDICSSLYGAHIQAQKRLSILCSSTEDEALSLYFGRANKRHSHRACEKTKEQGNRKVLVRDTRAAFLMASQTPFSLWPFMLISYCPLHPEEMFELSSWFKRNPE